eukprot:489333-Pelagomonas_calceolata.AAC.7
MTNLAFKLKADCGTNSQKFKEGDLQPDCLADQPVADPRHPTANPGPNFGFESSDTKMKSSFLCCRRKSNTAWTLSCCRKKGRARLEHLEFVRMSTNWQKRTSILPRCSFHIQSMSSQPKLAAVVHDMLRQIQMQVLRYRIGLCALWSESRAKRALKSCMEIGVPDVGAPASLPQQKTQFVRLTAPRSSWMVFKDDP